MINSDEILNIYPESFKANVYSTAPFRMIGIIDVNIKYNYGIEKVSLAFFRSSGTNSGKIKGLWYPIVGIKTHTGKFTEFTEYLNFVLRNSTKNGRAREGWLAKSLFFSHLHNEEYIIRGFSNGRYHRSLLEIGKKLRDLYEKDEFQLITSLDSKKLNSLLTSKEIYKGNTHSQKENFEKFIQDIFDLNNLDFNILKNKHIIINNI
ncbi:hypothetical protein [Clostridium sp. ZBS15]|uniref:hypothetical protein n=1 Tax=Clostridium sp. ZBS15 TaxID=2949969 RepID=UPI00207A442A|nr:hypothetical protein [Clostridium sp. ZBS15]